MESGIDLRREVTGGEGSEREQVESLEVRGSDERLCGGREYGEGEDELNFGGSWRDEDDEFGYYDEVPEEEQYSMPEECDVRNMLSGCGLDEELIAAGVKCWSVLDDYLERGTMWS